MTVLEHLRSAKESLSDAQDEANMGTALMIRPIQEKVEDLIDRTERIDDDN